MKVFKKITSSMRFLTLLTLLASNCMLVKASDQAPKRAKQQDELQKLTQAASHESQNYSDDFDDSSDISVTISELKKAGHQAPLHFEGSDSPEASTGAPQYRYNTPVYHDLGQDDENGSEDDTEDDLSSDDDEDEDENGVTDANNGDDSYQAPLLRVDLSDPRVKTEIANNERTIHGIWII